MKIRESVTRLTDSRAALKGRRNSQSSRLALPSITGLPDLKHQPSPQFKRSPGCGRKIFDKRGVTTLFIVC